MSKCIFDPPWPLLGELTALLQAPQLDLRVRNRERGMERATDGKRTERKGRKRDNGEGVEIGGHMRPWLQRG